MYYTVYQITNLVNGKIYVGKHKCVDPYDRYLGGGSIIERAVEKYGRENFRKDILHFCESEDIAFDKEEEIVDEEFVLREDTYNLVLGGNGRFNHEYLAKLRKTQEYRNKMSKITKTLWEDPEYWEKQSLSSKKLWEDPEYRKKQCEISSVIMTEKFKDPNERKKQSENQKKRYQDPKERLKNSESQKGKMWFYSPFEDHEQVFYNLEDVPEGYKRGRKSRKNCKMWVYSLKLDHEMRIEKNQEIPEGYKRGRRKKSK